jgi:hypothetical protein
MELTDQLVSLASTRNTGTYLYEKPRPTEGAFFHPILLSICSKWTPSLGEKPMIELKYFDAHILHWNINVVKIEI